MASSDNFETPPISADVVVIGAGIQGAGIAQACACNGWRVVVLERNAEPGLETSSASSKLIHGGLRYLESLQLPLVYECLAERRRLLANAPGLARLEKFYIPVYSHSSRKPAWIAAGLSLYALLGGMTSANRFHRVRREHWAQLPIAKTDLKAVFSYCDAQTDDTQLTRAVLDSAVRLGADVKFNAEVTQATQVANGFTVHASAGNVIATRCLINAAGPWVDKVAQRVEHAPRKALDWVQGVHLVLARPAPQACFYVEAPSDRRPMFVLPWQGQTLVGTTERSLDVPEARATDDEVNYLLCAYNQYFPEEPCTSADVVRTMAGVRVLPKSDTSANRRQRDTQFSHWRGDGWMYLGVYGGKLTSYRAVAEKISYRVADCLGVARAQVNNTRHIHLE